MNIYVLTENHYLFTGISLSLATRSCCHCMQLKPQDKNNNILFHHSNPGDVFIIASENSNIDFSMLMELNETNASVIVAINHIDWKISSIFRFSTIPRNFYFSDLLQSIHLMKPVKNKEIKLPKITRTEREVLLLTMKGVKINYISFRLNISTKTAYAHQRSAFRKIGIRKCLDMAKLPDNYLNYLCGAR